MKLYDFSAYAKWREAQRKAEKVQALREKLNDPGVVIELKREIDEYMALHRDVTRQVS